MTRIIKITQKELKRLVESIISEAVPPSGGEVPMSALGGLTKDELYILQGALKQTEFGNLLGTSGPNKDGVDGILGTRTKTALSKFQEKNKITGENGILGAKSIVLLKPLMDKVKIVRPTTKQSTPSTIPSIKPSYLFYDGKTLKLVVNGKAVASYNAWSGRTKWNAFSASQKALVDRMVNKIDFMKIKGAGPIPEGSYYLGDIQKRTNGDALKLAGNKDWYELLKLYDEEVKKIGDNHNFNAGTAQDMIAWGNYRMAIIKKSGTETFGRGSFYLHGGGLAGSIGCIDLVDRIDDFVATYKSHLSRTGTKTIDLYVDYSGKMPVPNVPIPYVSKSPENVGYPKSDKLQDFIDTTNKNNTPFGNYRG
jgi:peptidoglycan hydrolase-like protein with peptidoglycan-binding domain